MEGQEAGGAVPEELRITRRSLLRGIGYGAVAAGAVGTSGLLAACGSGIKGAGGSSATGTINIGFITPLTGQLAGFASGDQFVLSLIKERRRTRTASKSAARLTRSTSACRTASRTPREPPRWRSS